MTHESFDFKKNDGKRILCTLQPRGGNGVSGLPTLYELIVKQVSPNERYVFLEAPGALSAPGMWYDKKEVTVVDILK